MVANVEALRAFHRRLDAAWTPAQRTFVTEREAARLGIATAAWAEACAPPVSMRLLRTLHRLATGAHANVRRADPAGRWEMVSARAGHLRSRPQSFRVGAHVEPAWDHVTLVARLTQLVRTTALAFAEDPPMHAAHLVWAIARAQPFSGNNERVALILTHRLLRDAGLPGLHVVELEHDPAFAAALVAATETDHSALARYLETAWWNESLALAEWLAPRPAEGDARWTLRDEHLALAAARTHAPSLPDDALEAIAARIAAVLPARLATHDVALAASTQTWCTTYPERLRAAIAAARRGRAVCPHRPILDVRWPLAGGLGVHVILVLGSVGRGSAGAAAAHLALEHADHQRGRAAPALLLIPAEDPAARLDAWLGRALAQILRDSPVRC